MRTSLSGPVLQARQAIFPVAASSAVSQPRTPISPPLLPTRTLSLTTSGAIVMVSPREMSPSRVRQSSRPLAASIAIVCASRVLMNRRPSAYAAPRLTTSQQAIPCALAFGLGSNFHFTAALFGWRRSNA
jgi:hypothetical protein